VIDGLKKTLIVALLLVGIAGLACVDMSAPKGPASISLLQLPALYIVKGDVMRDTNGTPGTPSIIAYDSHGTPTIVTDAQFIFTDSVHFAAFDATGQIRGDSIGIAHLIGQIGALQTPSVPIAVTVAPAAMKKPIADTTLNVPAGGDSASAVGSVALGVSVTGGAGADTAIQGVIVTFALAPHASTQSYPSVFLADDNGAISLVDTTDASGIASRTLRVVSIALDKDVIAGNKPDSALVTATAKYKGAFIGGAPVVFKIPIKVVFLP
jgi:hypothetical protein